MLQQLRSLVVTLSYPPVLSAWLFALALVVLALGRRRAALGIVLAGVAWTGLWSLPSCSDWLRDTLEDRNPVIADAHLLPRADAIVVLGGGDRYEWMSRPVVDADALPYSRVAAGARAWDAQRAPLVILSGGRGRFHTEADGMARAMRRLGVPPSALLLERRSRDTRDNALYTARLARERGVRHVLLVTSAVHMPRASLWFRDAGIAVTPIPVPEPSPRQAGARWLPSRGALWRSGRALKEYAGLAGAMLRQRVQPLSPQSCIARPEHERAQAASRRLGAHESTLPGTHS